jgi:hypothetical protein
MHYRYIDEIKHENELIDAISKSKNYQINGKYIKVIK